MKILVFSDSHGNRQRMRRAIELQPRRVRAVFFLGDGLRDVEESTADGAELYTVCGNCDWFCGDAPTELVRELEGFRFLATHGHAYSVKSGLGALIARAVEADADVALFGHTHRCFAGYVGRALLINPGALKSGSYCMLTIDKGDVIPRMMDLDKEIQKGMIP